MYEYRTIPATVLYMIGLGLLSAGSLFASWWYDEPVLAALGVIFAMMGCTVQVGRWAARLASVVRACTHGAGEGGGGVRSVH